MDVGDFDEAALLPQRSRRPRLQPGSLAIFFVAHLATCQALRELDGGGALALISLFPFLTPIRP